nr:endogenous retrovirus group PABLB member 1 Env polyprotein-like [Syngnathus scovelli]
MNVTEAKCMASMGGVGYQHRAVTVKDADPYRPGLADGACDQLFWTNLNVTVKGRTIPQVAYTERPAGVNYTCYIQGNKTHVCINDDCSPGGNWMGALDITDECQDKRAISGGEGSPTNMATPSNGTYFIQNGWWLCGHKVYPMLPANWTGVCAPVWVTDHTYRIRHHLLTGAHNSTGRRRRAVATFDPHDPVWGANVPDDHKVWSVGDKVVLALFPQIGVGKLSLFIETLNYRFQSFVNLSLQVNDGQNREIQAIRLMVLQNRMVLDLLTAAQGGVCHIIGTSCCTYIPGENDTHINDAMNSLKNLQQAMSKDKVPHQFDFFSWLFSGNWWQLLLKLLSPVLVVLVVLCLFTTCVIPCLKSAVSKFVSSTVAQVHIQLLRDDGCDDDDETWIA